MNGSCAFNIATVALANTKTASRGARLQSVIVDDVMLVTLLTTLFGALGSRVLLMPGGLPALNKRWQYIMGILGLQGMGYTLGPLRAGGATCLFAMSQNLAAVMYRGRWDNIKTLGHYIHISLGAMAYARTSAGSLVRVRTRVGLFPALASGAV